MSNIYAAAASAETDIKVDKYSIRIELTGNITQSDANEFEEHRGEFNKKGISVHLNSEGGDAFAAMRIGKIVREVWGNTDILYAKCYSACALVYISGVFRVSGGGQLGLHRPFFSEQPQSDAEIEKNYPTVLAILHSYVTRMNITDEFYSTMVNTPPEKMAVYSKDALERLVPSSDPVIDEILVSKQARVYGLTTAEYRRRDQLVEARCGSIGSGTYEEHLDCSEPIMWGLEKAESNRRAVLAKKACWATPTQQLSAAESAEQENTPVRQKADLPFLVKRRECYSKIMTAR
ncbi:MAG: hypothetical protein WAL59_24625 [Roseiarcus sp.]